MALITREERNKVPGLDGRDPDVAMGRVVIDNDGCTGCQLCVDACPGNALEMAGKRSVRMIAADLVPCVACGDCVAICRPRVIQLVDPQRLTGFFRPLHRAELSLPRRF
jgi:ferredoxin